MRARDVLDKLKGRLDPEAVRVIMEIAEEQHAMARAIPAMAESFEKLSNVLVQHTRILENNKELLDNFKNRFKDVKSLGSDDAS